MDSDTKGKVRDAVWKIIKVRLGLSNKLLDESSRMLDEIESWVEFYFDQEDKDTIMDSVAKESTHEDSVDRAIDIVEGNEWGKEWRSPAGVLSLEVRNLRGEKEELQRKLKTQEAQLDRQRKRLEQARDLLLDTYEDGDQ